VPTRYFKGLRFLTVAPFVFWCPNGAQPPQKLRFPVDRPPQGSGLSLGGHRR